MTDEPPAPTSGGVQIRSATHRDINAVLDLWSKGETHTTTTDDREGLETLLVRDPEALLLAEVEGELVGSLIAGWDGWRGAVYRLVVLPRFRRRGIASELLSAGEDRLRALGARRSHAIALEDEAEAVGFWSAGDWQRHVGAIRFTKTVDRRRPS